MGSRNSDERNAHFLTFPMASEPHEEHRDTESLAIRSKRNVTVLSSRTKAGFGGMVTVSAVLFAIQFITGIQAFPL